jgi:hypothetical protein
MRRARKFLALPAAQRRLLLRTAFLLGVTRFGLWLFPFRAVQKALGKLLRKRTTSQLPAPAVPTPQRVAWAVGVASRWIPVCTCLVQALATHQLLIRYGWGSKLHIGVAKEKGMPPEGHAWVECDGEAIVGGGDDLTRFARILSFEGDCRIYSVDSHG